VVAPVRGRTIPTGRVLATKTLTACHAASSPPHNLPALLVFVRATRQALTEPSSYWPNKATHIYSSLLIGREVSR